MAEQTQADRSGLREAIITTSLELASQYGEDGLTMRAVAARLGTSATTLYQHFDGKAAILQEIRLRGLRQLSVLVLESFEAQSEEAALRSVSHAYVRFARDNPWLYRLLFHSEELPQTTLTAEQVDQVDAYSVSLRERVMLVLGHFAQLDPSRFSAFLGAWWCMLHGLCSLVIGGRLRTEHPLIAIPDTDAFIAHYIDAHVVTLLGRLSELRQP